MTDDTDDAGVEQDWPTPSFDRAGAEYRCSKCRKFVKPQLGDKQAALLSAGATFKLCGDCAQEWIDELWTCPNCGEHRDDHDQAGRCPGSENYGEHPGVGP